ncbi:MAG TPA: metallopeptidase TldD-related protein [Thermotogota bacterium]|nr:metallopeptidase TldD-related protein [Thermotogota bacterium]
MDRAESKALVEKALWLLKKAGATQAEVKLALKNKQELNLADNKMSLYRTTQDIALELVAFSGYKKSSKRINQLGENQVEKAAREVVEAAKDSQEDEANAIADYQPAYQFQSGPEVCDFENVYRKLDGFIKRAREEAPAVNLMEGAAEFDTQEFFHVNSNGLDNFAKTAFYEFGVVFMAVKEKKRSSFNYSGILQAEPNQEFYEAGSIMALLKQSELQLDPQSIPGNFVGDVIFTPDCLGDVLEVITENLKDRSIYTGTSIFTSKLHQVVAHPSFTLVADPVGDEMPNKSYFTENGYLAKNKAIIENGVLNTYLLSLYGSRKTGLARSETIGKNLSVAPGTTLKDDMIKGIKKGILLGRFSGGEPAPNGDFSGVAKNSFYIEDGEIKYAIKETMISGNMRKMLFDIKAISADRRRFGYATLPWVHVDGISVVTA